MAKGGMLAGRLSRRILAAAFFLLLLTASAAVFFVFITRWVSEGLLEAQLSSGAPEAPFTRLSDALIWGQGSAVAALSLLTAGLFALAFVLRGRVLMPPDGLGRAPAGGAEDPGLQGLKPLIERLSKDALRLEADLALLSTATAQVRASIEESSVRAAKASFAAIEAAEIVRDGAERMTLRAGAAIAAQGHATDTGAPHGFDSSGAELTGRFATDTEAVAVLTSLAGDLEALERFARDRKTIAGESAAALTVALVEAIDRLNGVADRISATADLSAKEQAA